MRFPDSKKCKDKISPPPLSEEVGGSVKKTVRYVQGLAKEWSLGCVNLPPAARGSQQAGFTQPRDHYFAQPRSQPPSLCQRPPTPLFCQNTTYSVRSAEKELRKSIFVCGLAPRGPFAATAAQSISHSNPSLLPTLHPYVYSASIVRCSVVHRPSTQRPNSQYSSRSFF